MAKFIYLYRGPATAASDSTPEQGAERAAAFGAWVDKAGAALVDVGSPFGPGTSVRDDGMSSGGTPGGSGLHGQQPSAFGPADCEDERAAHRNQVRQSWRHV